LVSKLRAEKPDKDKKNSGAELYCPEEALSDNDEADKSQKSHNVLCNYYPKRTSRVIVFQPRYCLTLSVTDVDILI